MEINRNIDQIISLLQRRGWSIIKNEDTMFIKLSNDFIFITPVIISIPINISVPDFPEQLKLSLSRICQIEPELTKNNLVKILVSQGRNMKNKFSKKKSEWILGEPDSKYNENEIPNIYIPKK